MSAQQRTEVATSRIPPSEVVTSESIVQQLLEEQFPEWSHLDIELAASGWDNVTYRLGAQLAVRLPRLRVAVDLLLKEQRFLPMLVPQVDIALPTPVRVGCASSVFPWPFSIVPWHGRAHPAGA